MKIMFNDLDRPFELSNSQYKHEIRKILCFTKYHNLTHTLSIYIILDYVNISNHFTCKLQHVATTKVVK
jgi:hypothetical protein